MATLLVFKERLKQIYCKYGVYIMPSIKFFATLISILVINSNLGYMSKLDNILIVLLIALIASFLPGSMIVLLISGVILAHLYTLAMELAAVTLVLYLIMYLLYFRYTPNHTFVLVLLPVLFVMKIPYVAPLIMGLVSTPISIISIVFGTMIYYIMSYTSQNAVLISNMSADSGVQKINMILDAIFKNDEMILFIISFSIATIAVYIIKRLTINYAWTAAIIVGCLLDTVILLCGELILIITIGYPIWLIIIGNIFSGFVIYLIHFFILAVDYSRTEYTQFEDDEYYYYVKAVPKMSVTAPEVKVKRINAQRVRRRRN